MFQQIIWIDIFAAAVTLFFVMDPIGNIPVFHSILKEFPAKTRMKIIIRELLISLIILLIFLFTGTKILNFLGLTQPTLNIAGGILLFLIAIRMVFAMKALGVGQDHSDPFIVPLAIPLVAGPSTITILMLQATSAPERIFEWGLALLLAWSISTIILVASPVILKFLGRRGVRALERLMGMLLILIAVQMLLDGVAEYLQNYI
ncbi:MAG: NAAT family transporter [Anaerolineae bacterium]|nr:NAAT family transporter [Anaerolineae bacterium]